MQCLRQCYVVAGACSSPPSSSPCSFALLDTHLPNAFLPFLLVPYCWANVLPPWAAPNSSSDCAFSALHSLAALSSSLFSAAASALFSCAFCDTHLP